MNRLNPYRLHNKSFWTQSRLHSLYLGILLIVLAVVIQIAAGQYSALHAASAPPESDIFLDNLPIVHLGFVIVGWMLTFWFFSIFLLTTRPRYFSFGLKSIALVLVFRAFFMNLTREGIYPGSVVPSAHNAGFFFYSLFTFQGNLFFSGHTAFPFLFALIFWNEKGWRRLYLILTVLFGATVLLAHVHYSIDVFAAPFIVYGTYRITARLFPHDYALAVGSHERA